jgi:hypothetical protein
VWVNPNIKTAFVAADGYQTGLPIHAISRQKVGGIPQVDKQNLIILISMKV